MRKKISMFLFCTAVLFMVSKSEAKVAGGFMFGSPSGLTLLIDNTYALGLGGWGHGVVITVDRYLIHKPIQGISTPLNWYLGIGGELGFWYDEPRYRYWNDHYENGPRIGARLPIGIQFPFEQRWEVFAEIVPVMMLFPFYSDLHGGIGIRYTF